MRPALKSGLLPVWRDRDTLQIGVDPRRAVALSGMSGAADLIGLLDGSRDREQVIAAAAERGIPRATSERVLALLAAGGALDDFPGGTLRTLPAPLRSRLAPELAAASLAYRDTDGGARTLARRSAAVIELAGDRRITGEAERILRAAGLSRVRPYSGGWSGAGPTLVIVAGWLGARERDVCGQCVAEGVPHLAATAREAIGEVGPLVLPGESACLRCLDHARAGRDPAWPLILSQICARRPDPPACDAVLVAAVAAQAAAQALLAIDQGPAASAAVNGTLELVPPDFRWRRRSWPPHPDCTCAPLTRPDQPAAGTGRPSRFPRPPAGADPPARTPAETF
ncbi:MAG: hypothetical protein ACYCO9_17320 [Streptosporangiaceae bacterium]